MSLDKYDTIYRKQHAKVEKFAFTHKVADVFDNMIQRSVPGYKTFSALTATLAAQYTQPHTACYDLGCAVGEVAHNIGNLAHNPCSIVGVDNSQAMLDKACSNMPAQSSMAEYRFICADICQMQLQPASVMILNFTLQFVESNKRLALLQDIYQSLLPQGILLLAEKVHASEQKQDKLFTQWHEYFKQSQGYSQLEIRQKRESLENRLITDSIEQHESRLYDVGFKQVYVVGKFLNFVLFIAIKS